MAVPGGTGPPGGALANAAVSSPRSYLQGSGFCGSSFGVLGCASFFLGEELHYSEPSPACCPHDGQALEVVHLTSKSKWPQATTSFWWRNAANVYARNFSQQIWLYPCCADAGVHTERSITQSSRAACAA